MNICSLFLAIIIAAVALFITSIEARHHQHFIPHQEKFSLHHRQQNQETSTSPTKTITVKCDPSVGGELIAARDQIRSLQPLQQNILVQVSGTCVAVNHSSPVLELDGKLDSAPTNSQYTITWQGATIRGGIQIPYSKWQQSSASTWVVDLTQLGITSFKNQIGSYAPGSLGQCTSNRAELYLSGAPMILARAPNVYSSNGPWMNWDQISDADSGNTTSFSSMSNQAGSGLKELASAAVNQPWSAMNSVWSHGYWSYDWADSWVRIENVTSSVKSKNIEYTLNVDPSTPPVYGFKKNARFYVSNHLSLLDSSQEYYIDDNLLLHFVAPSGLPGLEAWVSINNNNLISQVENGATLNGVSFRNLDVRYGRQSGVSLQSCNNCVFDSSVVNGFSKVGISMNGYNNIILNNNVSQTGCSGISINGGDSKTLTPSNSQVTNNDISFMGRITRSYQPGIHYGGVGTQIISNNIYQGPHAGILGSGNNILIKYNNLNNLVFGSRDTGSFYTGRSWTRRGTLLQQNTFTNIRTIEPSYSGSTLVVAIYFDDEQSGMTAEGNVCDGVDGCFLLGGGRDNSISNNTCKNVDQYCVHFDNRGMNWQREMCTPPNGQLVQGLFQVNYTNPPYSTSYPRIVNTLSDRPCVPVGNVISNNLYQNCTKGFVSQSNATIASWGSTLSGNKEV